MYQYGGSLFSLSFLPKKINSLIKKIYITFIKIIYKKPFTGQIERDYLNKTKREYIKESLSNSIIKNIVKENEIHNMDRIQLDNIVYILICEDEISNKEGKNR